MNDLPPPERSTLELRDYLAVVRRQALVIIGCTVGFAVIAFAYASTRTPQYEATAQVLLDVGYSRTVVYATQDGMPGIDQQVVTEADLMRSPSINETINETLGYEPEVLILVRPPTDDREGTRSISVIGMADNAQDAARNANDFATTYVTVRRQVISEDLDAAIAENEKTLDELDKQTVASMAEIQELNRQIEIVLGEQTRLELEVRRDRLLAEVGGGTIGQRQAEIRKRTDLLLAAKANNESRSIFRVGGAAVPAAPVAPTPKRDAAVAALIGLVVGLGLAFVRDYYDDRITSKDDLERMIGTTPVLGLIPFVRTWRKRDLEVLEAVSHPSSSVSEAYRGLRTALEFASIEHKVTNIHVTSSLPGEGKTTTAANLAVTLARAGRSVLLIDCDLRRPRLHRFFELPNDVGFTSVLLGDATFNDAVHRISSGAGLMVLTSGPLPPNPAELLSAQAAKTLLTTVSKVVDHVIIDSPPLLPVTDSLVIAGYADSTLLVVTARSTTRRSLTRSLELLHQVDAPLEGVVFNSVHHDDVYGGYGYGYEEDAIGGTTNRWWSRS